MKKFLVCVQQKTVEYCTVEIVADSEEQARRKVLRQISNGTIEPDWCDGQVVGNRKVARIEEYEPI